MAARLLALVAAVAMVAGAVAVRDRLDERGERRATTLRLVCATELGPVCEAVAASSGAGRVNTTVEDAGVTAERLSAAHSGASAVDGWLVSAPWPTIVAEARRRAGLEPVLSAGAVLGRSPVVLAVWADRARALAGRCGGPPGWKCLGEVAGASWSDVGGPPAGTWGPVKFGHAGVASATGLAVVGGATAAWFGRATLSRADLDDDAYRAWLARLEQAAPPTSLGVGPFEDMLLRGPAAYDAVATLEAEAAPLLARSARPDKPQLLYPAPVATADVVLAVRPSRQGRLLADAVAAPAARRALAAAGWRVRGETPRHGVPASPPLPAGDGLPAPGVLEAVRQVVDEVTP